MRKHFLLLLTVILTIFSLLLPSGCSNSKNSSSLGTGKLSLPTYTVTAPAAGEIIGLIIEPGERITKDQPLFAIQDTALAKEVQEHTLRLAKAEAELKALETGTPANTNPNALIQAKAQLEQAQSKAQKMQQLYQAGAVSRRQAENAQEELVLAQQQLRVAQQGQSTLEAASPERIAEQKKLLEKLQQEKVALRQRLQALEAPSPCTGTLEAKKAENKQKVEKGQIVLTLKALDSARLTITVTPKQAEQLKLNQAVQLLAKDSKAPFSGKITKIEGQKISISSQNKPENLPEGTEITVSLQ